jgi:hypothetical protein
LGSTDDFWGYIKLTARRKKFDSEKASLLEEKMLSFQILMYKKPVKGRPA